VVWGSDEAIFVITAPTIEGSAMGWERILLTAAISWRSSSISARHAAQAVR
jgi:hypothetical protein